MSADVLAMQRDMTRCFEKVFGTGLLPPHLDGLSGRARANLHAAIGGELARRGEWTSAAGHLIRAFRRDARRMTALAGQRVRRVLP